MTPRPEYPRPILQRHNWLNLNGQWSFATDPHNVGVREQWWQRTEWTQTITVPFCPNSAASGVTVDSDMSTVWYQRVFTVPDWGAEEIALNIGACDYDTWIYINDHQVGQHRGGYTPIHIAIGDYLQPGNNTITVRAADSDSWQQPRGKQAGTTRWPIDYDSVIGIWQSVWLEPVDPVHLLNIGSHYAIDAHELQLTCELSNTPLQAS